MKDLGVGYGVFVRQEQPFVSVTSIYLQILKDNMLINIGEAYVVINIFNGPLSSDLDLQDSLDDHKQNLLHLPNDFDASNDYDDGTQRLKIKIFGGPSAGEVFFFRACQ